MLERYSYPQMRAVWEPENKYRKWLEIELLACEAWAEIGVLPGDAVERLKDKAGFPIDRAFTARVEELEREVRHDVIAFTSAVAERVGEEGRYIHYGLTSYDVVDTALSCLMAEAAGIILGDIDLLMESLGELARRYKHTPMIGRTHGVHAEPITFGLKLALWREEMRRNRERMESARARISVGKLSGAVGTYAQVDPRVEEYVCRKLGLEPAPVSSQVLQRDRHAEYMTALAITAGSIEKFATEIRSLQRTEIREAEEPFGSKQKGSSAMPHKRNPVVCEQLCGLARVVRANCLAALENMNLWHERDISNSSVERIVIPDSTILVDYMLRRFNWVLEGLRVFPGNMAKNLELTGGLIFSGRLLLALVEKGMAREEAYRTVQRLAMEAWESGTMFKELLWREESVRRLLGPDELDDCLDYRKELARVDYIFERLGL